MERLREAEERVAAARQAGGAALQAALRERFAARRVVIEAARREFDGAALAEAANQLASLLGAEVEYLLVFDRNGALLLRVEGTAVSVWFPDGDLPHGQGLWDQWQGAVVAHTHPVAIEAGANASDLCSYSRLDAAACMVAYRRGRYGYIQCVSPEQGAWPSQDALYSTWVAEYNEGAFDRPRADDRFHRAMERTARKLHLTYHRESIR